MKPPAASEEDTAFRHLWRLSSRVLHLNNGSFGATPLEVQRALAQHRATVDEDRDHYFRRVRAAEVDAARAAAAAFLNADLGGLTLVPNASAGITAVLRSFPLGEDDEVLVTNHTYGAARLAATEVTRYRGARVATAVIPLAADDDSVVASIERAATARTRLAIIDNVTSPTAEVWPVHSIVRRLQAHNVAVLIDAAHAPGMVPVDLARLGADFWTGNFHKWAFSGLTVAGLYVAEAWRGAMRTPIVSHDEDAGYPVSFGLQGTLDYSVAATLPVALALLTRVGWEALARRNHEVAVDGAAVLAEALGTRVVEGTTRASMSLVELPAGVAETPEQALRLQERIEDELRAQTSIVSWGGRGYLRLSVQGYVGLDDVAALGERLRNWEGL